MTTSAGSSNPPSVTFSALWQRSAMKAIEEVFVLADYDNCKAGASREETDAEAGASLERLFEVVDDLLRSRGMTEVKRVYLYLYGGWLDEKGRPSAESTRIGRVLPRYRSRKIAASHVTIATKIALEAFPERSLIGTRYGGKQKMVDAMLALDAAHFATPSDPSRAADRAVVIVSADVDILPGLVSRRRVPQFLLRLLRRGATESRPDTFPHDRVLGEVAEIHSRRS